MSYDYEALEQILEEAAYRLPVKSLGLLLTKVDRIIETNDDSTELEREIQQMLGRFNVFSLKKLGMNDNTAASEAA